MKQFKIKVTYTFTGEFVVNADSRKEAKEIVDTNTGLTIGEVHTNDDDVKDWDFPVHPEVKIHR